MTKTWIGRCTIALGVLALLFAVAAAVLIATFDANHFKTVAIDWMKTEHQRRLVIDGPIELSFFPRLAVTVSGLRLSEAGRDDEFAVVEEAALAVRVVPLLSKELVIDRVSVRGVRASYLRDAEGVRNIDDFVPDKAGAETSAGAAAGEDSGESAGTMRFDVSAVEFEDLRLRVRDELADVEGELVLQSFSSGRLANKVKSPVSLQATLRLTRPQAVEMALDGSLILALDLDENAIAMSELKLGVDGAGAGVEALSLVLEGALAWDGSMVSAGPLQLALKSATLSEVSLAPSRLSLTRALLAPDARRFELEALRLALAGRQATQLFELELDWPKLAVDATQLEGSGLSGRLKLTGPNTLEGSFESAAPSGNFNALRLPGVDLTLAGSIGGRSVDGGVKAGVVLNAGEGAVILEGLQLRATLADPASGLQPLQLVVGGSASADAGMAQWKLNGTLNTQRFDTSGQAVLTGAVPHIKASADFDSLDLNQLLAGARPAVADSTTATATSSTATASADTPVPLDGLQAVNGEFELEAGALVFRHYKVADARLVATLDKGLLHVSTLSGRAWGGSFAGSGSADANTGSVAAKLDARGVDVNALLKDVADKDVLEGTGNVAADLTSGGATVGALRSRLGGSAALQLRDGAIKGINLARSLRQAKAALSRKQDAVVQAKASEKTDFSAMSVSARIADGVAHSDDLDIKSPFLRIGGEGRVDIGRGRIDYEARATVIASPAGQGGAELEALRGVTVPVALSGPIDAIDWTIQWSTVVTATVKQKLKDELSEKLSDKLGTRLGRPTADDGPPAAPATPQDMLKDTLKGLFR